MSLKIFVPVILVLFSFTVKAQKNNSIITIDFVKMIEGKEKQALYFYENNWKVYREIALQKGFIKSYKMLFTNADSTADFQLMLITEYADSAQFKESENRFQVIIKETRPNGAALLDDNKPNDFRKNVFFKQASCLFSSDENK